MPNVQVNLRERSYGIHVERRALPRAAEFLPAQMKFTRALIVTDSNVAPLYGGAVEASFARAGLPASLIVIPAGEREKNLSRVEALYHEMARAGLDRRSLAVALGGGVVGDITGFAAATYMRGIHVMQIPTTIVAQVDSSIGGKTGVDLAEGKNLVGAFHQPIAVVADPEALSTLPAREVRAGLAEVVKHGVITDAAYFGMLEGQGARLLAMDAATAEAVVLRSVEIKAAVVSADEREGEGGPRATLNFGHTVGHALEAATRYEAYLHGEAVAVGMVAAANIALAMDLCSSEVVERITSLLRAIGLPTTPAPVGPAGGPVRASDIVSALALDKKAVAGRARFVLPREIGRVEVVGDVPSDAVMRGLRATGFAG